MQQRGGAVSRLSAAPARQATVYINAARRVKPGFVLKQQFLRSHGSVDRLQDARRELALLQPQTQPEFSLLHAHDHRHCWTQIADLFDGYAAPPTELE